MIAPNCHSQSNSKHLELLSSKSIIKINQNVLDSHKLRPEAKRILGLENLQGLGDCCYMISCTPHSCRLGCICKWL